MANIDTKEVIKKIRHIDIITNRVVTEVLAGRYHSVFKGMGIEFSDVREYQPGDDIRSIDWNVFARLGHPFIKKYVEERELTVIIFVDVSGSFHFGTQGKFKSELAAELSALFSFSAIRNNDKVGLVLFSNKIEKYIPPKKGKNHVLRVIRDVLCYKGEKSGTNINCALEFLNSTIKKRSVVFFISDFFCSNYDKLLRISNKKHDIIPVVLEDPMESSFINAGVMEIEDAETGESLVINTNSIKKEYEKKINEIKEKRKKNFQINNIKEIYIKTNEDFIAPIIKYFKKRGK